MPGRNLVPWRALRVLALLTIVGAPWVSPAPASAATAPADLVVDLTFPAEPGGRYGDDFASPRSGGRTHCATDILSDKHSDVYAAVSGTITFMPMAKPSYGYMISLQGDDGRKYSYVHLNDDTPGTNDDAAGPEHAYAQGLAKGSKVARGQLIGYVGDSGNAKGTPHLHFEIHDAAFHDPACESGGSGRVNPYRSLQQADANGDHGGATTPGNTQGAARSTGHACPPGDVPVSGFTDVGPTHQSGVDCVAWWRVASGTSATTFDPTSTITREQLATFVANIAAASGTPLPATSTDHFDDDAGSVHEANIDRVAAAGIMGSTTQDFWPRLAVTRGSMATVVAKTYRYTGASLPPGPDAFGDDDGHPSETNIDAVVLAGIAAGYDDGTYRPSAPVTREQMATFFARLLDLLVASGNAAPPAS